MIRSLDFYSYNIHEATGYGIIAKQFAEALKTYTDLDLLDKSVNILNFCMPEHYKFKDITIGYTPWESTEVPASWLEPMKAVDDLWTTSRWVADVFRNYTNREPFVLPHGISEWWQPIKHHREEGPFTFVHVGEPAIRKGGDIVLQAWYNNFRNNADVQLIFKCRGYTTPRIYDADGSIIASAETIDNVHVITDTYHPAEMWRLYALSDCMIYPSRGEGFGMIPFEALACALPTILPGDHIGDFGGAGIQLHTLNLVESENQTIHPGRWLDFNEDELIWNMQFIMNEYDRQAEWAFKIAKAIHEEYSWETIIGMAMDRIETIS